MNKNEKRDLVIIAIVIVAGFFIYKRMIQLDTINRDKRDIIEYNNLNVKEKMLRDASEAELKEITDKYNAKVRGENYLKKIESPPIFESSSVSAMEIKQEKYYKQYTCLIDCAGHEAGYNWAKEKNIDNSYDCRIAGITSNSPSFSEGCQVFVDEVK